MEDVYPFSRPIKITVENNGQIIFERVFKNGPITFGRTTKNDVTLEFGFVSRSHCRIFESDGHIYLEDLKSSNGITVHGHKVNSIEITEVFNFNIGVLVVQVEKEAEDKTELAVDPYSVAPGPEDKTPVVRQEVSVRPSMATTATQQQKSVPVTPPKTVAVEPAAQKKTEQKKSVKKEKSYTSYKPVLNKDFSSELLDFHHDVLGARYKKVEAVVTWHDQVYDVREFSENESIIVGTGPLANLPLPGQQDWALAKLSFDSAQCFVPQNREVSLIRGGKAFAMGDLLAQNQLQQKELGYKIKITAQDVLKVSVGSDLKVTLRYVPASRQLTQSKITEPDRALKDSLIGSGALHLILALTVLMGKSKVENVPKLQNVPERFARLLVEKPKPTPTPKPTPKPPEKKVVEKKPEPKKVVKQKPVVIKTPKVIAKNNKFPMTVKNPMPKAPPPTKVETLGALGALGAMSNKATPNVVTNININPNAGGMTTKINTGGIAGALPSSNGKLVAAGSSSRVKTKGMGYGTGTGYGIQGLKGAAGSRGVAGAIVGAPKLASSSRLEGLTRAQVMAVVQKYIGEVQACYERNLLTNAGLAGRMEFEWDISAGGQVTSVRVKRSTVTGGDALGECVKGIFFSMKFPQATNGATTTPNIGFPFGRL